MTVNTKTCKTCGVGDKYVVTRGTNKVSCSECGTTDTLANAEAIVDTTYPNLAVGAGTELNHPKYPTSAQS